MPGACIAQTCSLVLVVGAPASQYTTRRFLTVTASAVGSNLAGTRAIPSSGSFDPWRFPFGYDLADWPGWRIPTR